MDHQCRFCLKFYVSAKGLQTHIKDQHPEEPWVDGRTNRTIRRECPATGGFQCKTCGSFSKSKQGLRSHNIACHHDLTSVKLLDAEIQYPATSAGPTALSSSAPSSSAHDDVKEKFAGDKEDNHGGEDKDNEAETGQITADQDLAASRPVKQEPADQDLTAPRSVKQEPVDQDLAGLRSVKQEPAD